MLVGAEQNYPVFISYPRTGSHWINCLAELYFDRPRLRQQRVSLLSKPTRTDYMWIHDHDQDCLQESLPHDNIWYLYRDPVATVYSNLAYSKFESLKDRGSYEHIDFCEEAVESMSCRYRAHLHKWLTNPSFKPRTILKYERFTSHPLEELKKIVDHFQVIWDADKASSVFAFASKERMLAAESMYEAALNTTLVSDVYKNNRDRFEQLWGEKIKKLVITDQIQSFF